MDAIKTLIEQILNIIKALGSDNSKIGSVIESLKKIFEGFGQKDETAA